MFLRTTLYGRFSFGLKVRKNVFLSARALIIALYVSGVLGWIFIWLWARALIPYSWKAIKYHLKVCLSKTPKNDKGMTSHSLST
jgi:hypothetical protein